MVAFRILSLITFIVFQCVFFDAEAQGQKRLYKGQYHHGKYEPKISLTNIKKREAITFYGNTGYATYYGDLCDGFDCFTFRPQLGAGVMLRTGYLEKRFNLRVEARYFRMYSNDTYAGRNLDFRSSNFEFLALGQVDLFPYEKMMRRRNLLNPYIYAGIGMMTFNPSGSLNGSWYNLRSLQTEHTSYGSIAGVATFGLGVKIRYTYKINFMAEAGYRFTTTDYIDDASQHAFAKQASFSDPLAASLSNKTGRGDSYQGYRGNPKNNDGYFIFSAGVTYTMTNAHQARFRGKQHLLRKS